MSAQVPLPSLPSPRLLANSPVVAEVGAITSSAGSTASIPLTPALAVTDLRLYDDQLATLFPKSASGYPLDSVRALKRTRAQAWLTRLQSQAKAKNTERQLIDFAEVAVRAEADTLAQRLIDRRLAQLPPGRAGAVPRSLTLAVAVRLFADVTQDSARFAHNASIATTYAAHLAALPLLGYPTRSDSTDVLYRQLEAFLSVVRAADALQQPRQVLAAADQALRLLPHLGLQERRTTILRQYPYLEVATALVSQPHGRTRLDALNAQLLALGDQQPAEVTPVGHGASDAVQATQEFGAWQRTLQQRFASFALLGQPAPPVLAHAWLNTPDSMYAEVPRVHPLTDGGVRVVAFGGMHSDLLPVLERLQQQMPTEVQVVFATATDGHIGPDIATPAEEVTWLARYYESKRRFTFPIAIWAGVKIQGSYGSFQPTPSPVGVAYYAGWINGVCLIDAQGAVRAYQEVSTREQEVQLDRRLRALLTESPPSVTRAH